MISVFLTYFRNFWKMVWFGIEGGIRIVFIGLGSWILFSYADLADFSNLYSIL